MILCKRKSLRLNIMKFQTRRGMKIKRLNHLNLLWKTAELLNWKPAWLILRTGRFRVQADFENFKRRTREDQAAQLKYKSQSLITQLLPALDNFERAMDVKVEDAQAASVLQGVEMVYRQLLEAVKSEGLEVIETEGATFDPNLHQAVMQVQDEEYESNVIVETLQKGYKLKDRVIRPAMVKVNQ